MDRTNIANSICKIDVEEILYSKNPLLKNSLPGFVLSYLKRIVHQDELNEFLGRWGHLKDLAFIEAGLNHFKIITEVIGMENLPSGGNNIFVSNHPLGGLDGLVFIHEISKHYSDIKFPVNDILTNIENLSGIFLPVNKHGAQGREAVMMLDEAYSSNSQILNFPAGLCSRMKRGTISDLQWQKSFITKAIQHKRDIVPAYISGRNSNFFYRLSNLRKFFGIKANIEMLYLVDEMFKQKEKKIVLVFGNKIEWGTFSKSRSPLEWADWVKSESYKLKSKIQQ